MISLYADKMLYKEQSQERLACLHTTTQQQEIDADLDADEQLHQSEWVSEKTQQYFAKRQVISLQCIAA